MFIQYIYIGPNYSNLEDNLKPVTLLLIFPHLIAKTIPSDLVELDCVGENNEWQ